MTWIRVALWVLLLAIFVGVLGAIYGAGYRAGADSVRSECLSDEIERTRAAETIGRLEAELRASQEAQVQVIDRVVVQQVEKVRTVTKVVREEVRVEVPVDLPLLPPAVRRLHDNAARGDNQEGSSSSRGADGSTGAAEGVAPQELVGTVVENYGSCRVNAERLLGLQRYVREVLQ